MKEIPDIIEALLWAIVALVMGIIASDVHAFCWAQDYNDYTFVDCGRADWGYIYKNNDGSRFGVIGEEAILVFPESETLVTPDGYDNERPLFDFKTGQED